MVTMQTSAWILLCLLSLLQPAVLLIKDAECSCLGLANVRRLIPEDASRARGVLYKMWKITERDFCRSTFQTLPISTLGLGKRRNFGNVFDKSEDRTLGPFLKAWMKEKGIKKIVQNYFWRNWAEKPDISEDIYLDRMINKTVEEFEKTFDSRIANLEIFAENIFTEMKEFVPSQGFFTFTDSLHLEDIKLALKGLACTWSTHSRSFSYIDQLEAFQLEAFEQVMKTRGVDNLNIENVRKIAEHFKKVLIDEEVNDLIKNLMNKIKSLLLTENYEFQSLVSELRVGKNTQLENFIIRILEDIEAESFFERMDTLYEQACKIRMDLFDKSLKTFLHILEDFSRFVSQSINKANKIDFNQIVILLNNINTDHKKQIKQEVGKVDNWLSGNTMDEIKEGRYTLKLISYILDTILFPQTSDRKCKDDLQMFNDKAKLITAEAVQTVLWAAYNYF